MKIALIDTSGLIKKQSINKDLNGDYGTHDGFGNSIFSRFINYMRGNSVNIPLLSFIYIYTILLSKGHTVKYYYNHLPQEFHDIFILHGSIVDYNNENIISGELGQRYRDAKVGFVGTFPGVMPELFSNAGFIIHGEADAYFLYQFEQIEDLDGMILVDRKMDMDDLPSPNYTIFPYSSYKYKPILNQTPFLTIQASRGCPYSCGYYCTYPTSQGKTVRYRNADLLIEDILYMKRAFSMQSLLFRDPIFGIDKKYPIILSEKIIRNKISLKWGIETRIDLLSKDNLLIMKQAGLVSINVGIETPDYNIAKMNKRKLVEQSYQDEIIEFCNQIGIKVIGFFMIGLEGDTINSINSMINYAINQNIFLARFSVATPYPGTQYYDELDEAKLLLHKNFEKYTQFQLVLKHANVTPDQVQILLETAYKKFLLRPQQIFNLALDQIKSLV